MTELRLLIDELDLDGIVEYALPIVKEMLTEKGNALSMVKYLPDSALNGLAHEFLQRLSPAQKTELVCLLINRYKAELIVFVQNMAAKKGIKMTVKDVSAKEASSYTQ